MNYRPLMGGLDRATFAALEGAAGRVSAKLADSQRIYVNRSPESTIRALREGKLSTVFERAKHGIDIDPGHLAERRALEQQLGTHGSGKDAGRTVYGSLQFTDQLERVKPPPGWKLDIAAPEMGRVGNPGSVIGGPISLVLKPDVLRRARLLSADTFEVDRAVSAPSDRLPSVIVERFLRDTGLVLDEGTQQWKPLFAPRGGMEAKEAVRALARDPRDAERAIEQLVTGRNMADFPDGAHYIETQIIGGVKINDVERIALHPGLQGVHGKISGQIRQIRELAAKHDIPVSFAVDR